MKGKLTYSIDRHWTRAPVVWGTLAKVAFWAFFVGIIVGKLT